MKITDKKAILFDFDDTLQDRREAFLRYAADFLDRYFADTITAAEKQKRILFMDEEVNGGYRARENYFGALIQAWNWTDAPSIPELAEDYNSRFGGYVSLLPDAIPTLEALRKRGFLLGIITNGPSSLQNHKLDTANVRDYVDICAVSGDLTVAKPAPGIFTYVAEQLGVSAADCVFVGDHPLNDIMGAQNAGMQPVWMQYGYFSEDEMEEEIPTIQALSELLDLIQ